MVKWERLDGTSGRSDVGADFYFSTDAPTDTLNALNTKHSLTPWTVSIHTSYYYSRVSIVSTTCRVLLRS